MSPNAHWEKRLFSDVFGLDVAQASRLSQEQHESFCVELGEPNGNDPSEAQVSWVARRLSHPMAAGGTFVSYNLVAYLCPSVWWYISVLSGSKFVS